MDSNCGWDTKKVRTQSHEWVNTLTQNCTDVWHYLNNEHTFGDAGTIIKEQVWLEVCQCAFDTVLEGFSRIKKCTVEGRTNMLMDIQSLQNKLNLVHSCKPPRGKHYIEEFIKGSTLGEEALVDWMNENWQIYSYRHICNMLNMVLKSSLLSSSKKLTEAISILDGFYENSDAFDSNAAISLSTGGMLSMRASLLSQGNRKKAMT